MELIDRVKLFEDFRNTITENSDTFDWLNMINRQPIAYEPQKVVAKIDECVPEITNSQISKIQDIVMSGGIQ